MIGYSDSSDNFEDFEWLQSPSPPNRIGEKTKK